MPVPLLNKQRGQATVEFALVTPLVFACVGLLVGTTVMCLQYLSLHDVARIAARAAVMAEAPSDAAQSVVTNSSLQVTTTENLSAGTITVTVTRTGGLWWMNRLLSTRAISQSVTMMREAPIVLR